MSIQGQTCARYEGRTNTGFNRCICPFPTLGTSIGLVHTVYARRAQVALDTAAARPRAITGLTGVMTVNALHRDEDNQHL